MGVGDVLQTGVSGLHTAKSGIATTGHNITNTNTEGYSRQRVKQASYAPDGDVGSKARTGKGSYVNRIDRVNDEYVEKQLRNTQRDKDYFEERQQMLSQVENVFNEMGGEGMNRLLGTLFNDFRKLGNDPHNESLRQSLRESASSITNDFKRLSGSLLEIRNNIDSRIEGHVNEFNAVAEEIKDLNARITRYEVSGQPANDLRDKRDLLVKQAAGYMDLQVTDDEKGNANIQVRGIGPLVMGPVAEKFSVERSPADGKGKAEGAYDIKSTGSANGIVTHTLKGGKLGGLLEVRDQVISRMSDRLDELAYSVTKAVNEIHRQGFNRKNTTGIDFFKDLRSKDGAASRFDLEDKIKTDVNNIASAAERDAPGDNRIAVAISRLQGARLMNNGQATMDDFYNSMVSEVGIITGKNNHSLKQQEDMLSHLDSVREKISGVSLDEETANLLQYQHAYDASAKVITVADKLLETILDMR